MGEGVDGEMNKGVDEMEMSVRGRGWMVRVCVITRGVGWRCR